MSNPSTQAAVKDAARKGGVMQVQHPLLKHHLTGLRATGTDSIAFRGHIRSVATLLAYEATKDLLTETCDINTPLALAAGEQLKQRIGLVPILRAGLGMVDPVLDLIPTAEVWHLGFYRDEATARPVEYYCKLPNDRTVDVALVLDPMLATGGSAVAALSSLREWGVSQVKLLSVIASQEGVDTLSNQFPEAQIFVCAVDPELNDQKFIVPGLGDAGDRIFNTSF